MIWNATTSTSQKLLYWGEGTGHVVWQVLVDDLPLAFAIRDISSSFGPFQEHVSVQFFFFFPTTIDQFYLDSGYDVIFCHFFFPLSDGPFWPDRRDDTRGKRVHQSFEQSTFSTNIWLAVAPEGTIQIVRR